jgi:osmotically inducible lipoprotein OsmB
MRNILILGAVALGLSACANSRDDNLAGGAVVGGTAGALVAGPVGAVVGGAAGAVVADQNRHGRHCYFNVTLGHQVCHYY